MEEGTELAVETESKFNHQTIETYAKKEKKRNHHQHQPRQQHNYDDDNLVREVASVSSPPRALGGTGIIMVVKRMRDVSTTCLSQYPRMVIQSLLPDNHGQQRTTRRNNARKMYRQKSRKSGNSNPKHHLMTTQSKMMM